MYMKALNGSSATCKTPLGAVVYAARPPIGIG